MARTVPTGRGPEVVETRPERCVNAGEYARGNVGTNLVEGFFSQLKRSLDGTHHAVSTAHLDRYLTQFSFMYSHCRDTDSERMRRVIGNVDGRRLPYKPIAD